MSSLRVRTLPLVVLLALGLTASAPALGASPRQVVEDDGVAGPQYPVVADRFEAVPYDDVVAKGFPFLCGTPANAKWRTVETDCRIDATITVPAKVASFLGLSSRVIADGVAGNRVDHLRDEDGRDQGRAYFLPLSAKAKARLKARKVGALGIRIAGRVTAVGQDKVYCASDESDEPTPRASCAIVPRKKAIVLSGEDGELLCWRHMPWWLATPVVKYGARCPEPIRVP